MSKKRIMGLIIILSITSFVLWFLASILTPTTTFLSPIPEEKGVKVIYITPSK